MLKLIIGTLICVIIIALLCYPILLLFNRMFKSDIVELQKDGIILANKGMNPKYFADEDLANRYMLKSREKAGVTFEVYLVKNGKIQLLSL